MFNIFKVINKLKPQSIPSSKIKFDTVLGSEYKGTDVIETIKVNEIFTTYTYTTPDGIELMLITCYHDQRGFGKNSHTCVSLFVRINHYGYASLYDEIRYEALIKDLYYLNGSRKKWIGEY